MNLLVWPVGVRGRYLGDGEDFGADDGLVRALHVFEVEDDGVLEEREEDEHDARQEPDLIWIDLGKKGIEMCEECELGTIHSTRTITASHI